MKQKWTDINISCIQLVLREGRHIFWDSIKKYKDLPMGYFQFSSVQFSCSVVSESLWPHGLQHNRPPCPSPTPGVCSNSVPLSRWCHPTISCSVISFSSCPQSFSASGSFQMNQFFASGGQSIVFSNILQKRFYPQIFHYLSFSFFFLNWFFLRIIALHNFAVFCQTST